MHIIAFISNATKSTLYVQYAYTILPVIAWFFQNEPKTVTAFHQKRKSDDKNTVYSSEQDSLSESEAIKSKSKPRSKPKKLRKSPETKNKVSNKKFPNFSVSCNTFSF